MNASTRDNTKTRISRAPETGTLVGVRLQADLLHELDNWRRGQHDLPSRPDALRRIFRDWLTSHGFLKPAPLGPAVIAERIERLDAKAAALKHDGTKSPENALKTMDRALAKGKAAGLRKRLAKVRP